VPHLAQLRSLYDKDHPGEPPASQAVLEQVLGACRIKSSDLAEATAFWSGKISALGGQRTSSLSILKAFGKGITWSAPRDCWNMFIAVEALMKFRHEITALYVYDHRGASPKATSSCSRIRAPSRRSSTTAS
jgi:hypothetical protein